MFVICVCVYVLTIFYNLLCGKLNWLSFCVAVVHEILTSCIFLFTGVTVTGTETAMSVAKTGTATET